MSDWFFTKVQRQLNGELLLFSTNCAETHTQTQIYSTISSTWVHVSLYIQKITLNGSKQILTSKLKILKVNIRENLCDLCEIFLKQYTKNTIHKEKLINSTPIKSNICCLKDTVKEMTRNWQVENLCNSFLL